MHYFWMAAVVFAVAAAAAVPAARLLRRMPRCGRPLTAVLAAALTVAAIQIWLGTVKLHTFQVGLWDFGIYDSLLHLAAAGGGMMRDFRGGFFDHFSPAVLLLAPLYRIADRPEWLTVLQPLALAAGAPLLYLLSRKYFRKPTVPLLLSAMYLLNPYYSRLALFDFHIECLFPALFFGAFLARAGGRRNWFLALLIVAPLIKEDFVIPLGAVGLWMLFRRGERKDGALLIAAAGAWTLFVLKIYFPLLLEAGYWHYGRYLAPDGGIVRTAGELAARLFRPQSAAILLSVLLPFGLLPAADWKALLLLLMPVLGIQLISASASQQLLLGHYAAALLAAAPVAALFGLRRLRAALRRRPRLRRRRPEALTFLLLLALGGHIGGLEQPQLRYYSGVPEWDARFHLTFFHLPLRRAWHDLVRHAEELERVAAAIPPGRSVAAQNELGCRLLRRNRVFSLPGPAEGADFYLFDQFNYSGFDRPERLHGLLRALQTDPAYTVAYYHSGILLIARRALLPEFQCKQPSGKDSP